MSEREYLVAKAMYGLDLLEVEKALPHKIGAGLAGAAMMAGGVHAAPAVGHALGHAGSGIGHAASSVGHSVGKPAPVWTKHGYVSNELNNKLPRYTVPGYGPKALVYPKRTLKFLRRTSGGGRGEGYKKITSTVRSDLKLQRAGVIPRPKNMPKVSQPEFNAYMTQRVSDPLNPPHQDLISHYEKWKAGHPGYKPVYLGSNPSAPNFKPKY